MKKLLLILLICLSPPVGAFQIDLINDLSEHDKEAYSINITPDFPDVIIADVSYEIELLFPNGKERHRFASESHHINLNGKAISYIERDDYTFFIPYIANADDRELNLQIGNATFTHKVDPIPLWMSILPPIIAIFLALLIREVLVSLFIGVFTGAAIISFYSNGFSGIFIGFLRVIDSYIIDAIKDSDHLMVIIFSTTIAAVVSVISKNGGMKGVVSKLAPFAHNPKSGQLVVWLMGIMIFFDDYANTLVVGNTMRPVTDRLKISREKLAYIVDSTAAPVAAIAFITTWIGAELGYISDGLVDLPGISASPYAIFLSSLSYSFYPILTLIFILMLILKQRDYGSMWKVEIEARKKSHPIESEAVDESIFKEFESKEGLKGSAFDAILPILVIILGAIIGMLYTGYSADIWNDQDLGVFRKLSITIGDANSFVALLWSSVCGLFTAIFISVGKRLLSLDESITAALNGYKTMISAMLILILAWSLANITDHMATAQFLKGLWSTSLSPIFIPTVVFILSALVSFSTGSSWGTMAILYPLLLPASYQIAIESGMTPDEAVLIFYNVVSVILAGSVFGDHCSPISDTTILSSLASSCNHIDHVRTQLPYAITVGLVSILVGSIPSAMGVSSWILFPIAIALLYGIIQFLGKRVD